jgi:hypothetical protein
MPLVRSSMAGVGLVGAAAPAGRCWPAAPKAKERAHANAMERRDIGKPQGLLYSPEVSDACRLVRGKASLEPRRYSHKVDEFLDGPDTTHAVFTNGPCYFQIDVFWDFDRHPDLTRISAGIYFYKRAMFEKVDKALQDRFGTKFTTDDESRGCYLEKPIEL